jgi:hypothetical protein
VRSSTSSTACAVCPARPNRSRAASSRGCHGLHPAFFGLHFFVAALLAKIMRGSILAALLATFIGNPLTYVPIAIISLQTGHFLLGTSPRSEVDESIFAKFGGAAAICGTISLPSSRPNAPNGMSWASSTGTSSSPGWSVD